MTVLTQADFLSLGFADKSLWDWIDLLGVPVAVAIIAGLFALAAQRVGERARVERELATDRAREETLQTFFDRITGLILENGLRESEEDSPVRAVAHARTHTAFRTLDGPRKGVLVRFLHDAKLIVKGQAVISLELADLTYSDLSGADLTDSDLRSANLRGADFKYANLQGADLRNAVVTYEQLAYARDLVGASLSDDVEITEEEWQELRQPEF